MPSNAYVPPLFRGKEGRMNAGIVRYLGLNGPSLIYSVAKALAAGSDTKVHYPTVNRRVHDLVRRGYLASAGSRETKSGARASLFTTTVRGDFGCLASGLDTRDQFLLTEEAGKKPKSPFALLKMMVDRGMPFEFVRREFLDGIAQDVRNGYINIEALNEEVICSAFAASLARKLRQVMGEEKGREYVDSIIDMIGSLISPSPRDAPAQSFAAIAGAGAGAASGASMTPSRLESNGPFSPCGSGALSVSWSCGLEVRPAAVADGHVEEGLGCRKTLKTYSTTT